MEYLAEIAAVVKTTAFPDFCDRFSGIEQLVAGLLQADQSQIGKRRDMHLCLKHTVAFTDTALSGSRKLF